MDFDYRFLEAEVREGFYVMAEMKAAWAVQLSILKEIDRICEKYGITYFADFGTMLGAVRHGGMIPWDDDVDIAMKRADYMRFAAAAKDELSDKYEFLYVQDAANDFCEFIARIVVKPGDIEQIVEEEYGFPCCIGVDVFCLDGVPTDEGAAELVCSLGGMALAIAQELSESGMSESLEEGVSFIEEATKVHIDRGGNIVKQLFMLIDRLFMLYQESEAEYLAFMPDWIYTEQDYKYPKELWSSAVRMQFEDFTVPVPAGYDQILARKYGDYMNPVRCGSSHEYPFYRTMLEELMADGKLPYRLYPEDAMKQVSRYTGGDILKGRIVFIPYSPEGFGYMRDMYQQAVSEGNEVYVMPVPYVYKPGFSQTEVTVYDIDGYQEEVRVVSHERLSLEELQPDVIVFQNPYDDKNYTKTVVRQYYSDRLRECCKLLVYIPYFRTDEFDDGDTFARAGVEEYVMTPGVMNADIIYAQSVYMKQQYEKVSAAAVYLLQQ